MGKKAAKKRPRIQVVEDSPPIEEGEKPEAEVKSSEQSSFPFGANDMAKTKKKSATNKTAGPVKKKSMSAKIRKYHADHPEASTKEIAEALKTKYGNVYAALKSPTEGKGKKKATKKAKVRVASNGMGASEFLHAAFGLGLDKAIDILETVRKAIK